MPAKIALLAILILPAQHLLADELDVIQAIEETEGNLSEKLSPRYLKADFTGDGVQDFAVLIGNRLCLYDTTSRTCTYAKESFSWVDQWRIVTDRKSFETIVSEDGEITGERTVLLHNDSIELCKAESSCNLVSIKNKKLILLHQGG